MKAGTLEVFILMAGIVGLLLLRFGPGDATAAAVAADPSLAENWSGTPYYLRYNVPVASNSRPIMPRTNPLSFGLGVPSVPIVSQSVGGLY